MYSCVDDLDTGSVEQKALNLPNATTPLSLAAGNVNNFSTFGGFTVLDLIPNASGSTLTGIDNTKYVDGDMIIVRNHSATVSLPMPNESTLSIARNRFYWTGAANKTLAPRQAITIEWNNNVGGWAAVNDIPATSMASSPTVNTSPGRTLNTTFTPSATNDVEVTYSVSIATSITLTAGSAGHVDLACDTSSPPTTIVATVSQSSTGTLTLGLNLNASNTLVIRYRVPRNQNCRINTVNDVGTPTYNLVRQVEQTLP